jgi:hypothetical protein
VILILFIFFRELRKLGYCRGKNRCQYKRTDYRGADHYTPDAESSGLNACSRWLSLGKPRQGFPKMMYRWVGCRNERHAVNAAELVWFKVGCVGKRALAVKRATSVILMVVAAVSLVIRGPLKRRAWAPARNLQHLLRTSRGTSRT